MSLNIDPHPEEEEQCAKTHEDWGNSCDEELLEELSGELAGGHLENHYSLYLTRLDRGIRQNYEPMYLVNKEPGCEEQPDAEEDHG